MALEFPSKEDIRDMLIAIWLSFRPNADTTRYSDVWLFAHILASAMHRMHWTADRVLAALHPKTTWGIWLDAWLWVCGLPDGAGGYGRIQARGSSTLNACTVTATGATVDLQGYQLVDVAGRIYEIAESYAFVGAGSADLDLDAVTKGLATNLETGATVTFSSPPANVQAAATIALDLTGGANLETDAEGRSRLIEYWQLPAASGNVPDWADTIRQASPGEIDAFVWPWRQNQPTGWGLTDFCGMQRGANREGRHIGSGDALYATIAAKIAELMPGEHYYYSRQLTLTVVRTDISMHITLADFASSSQECDWDAYGVAGAHRPKVSAINPGGLQVTADKNITGWGDDRDIQVGDHVVISGAQAIVDTVGVGGNTKFTVSTWFDTYDAELNPYPWLVAWDPVTTPHYICSGGGLIMDVVIAQMEMGDALGPARGTYASPSILNWEDTLRLLNIQAAAIGAGGGAIVDCVVDAPAVDTAPTAGSGTSTQRIVFGDVAVHEVK